MVGILQYLVVTLCILLIIYLVIIFNGLIQLRNNIRKSWANIDVLLKQRHDELPNLIETVKGYMKHEKRLFTDITAARTAMDDAYSKPAKALASEQLTRDIKTLFAVAENYPKLQASENFLKLQSRISELEDSIADRREFYNDSVNTYNIRIQSIPDMVVAKLLRYHEEEMFKVDETEKTNIKARI